VYGRRREINTHWDLFIGIRNHLGESATGELAKYDVNNDGNIDLRDLTKARIPPELPSYQPWGFQGRIRCSYKTSGASPQTVTVYDFRARFYDPTHGRFLQRDPLALVDFDALRRELKRLVGSARDPVWAKNLGRALSSSELNNLYEFLRSNPNIYRDPQGKQASYGEQMVVSGVMNALFGALWGAVGKAVKPGATAEDVAWEAGLGFVSGALGGVGGFAFAASRIGLVMTIAGRAAAAGAVSGAISAATKDALERKSWLRVLGDAALGAAFGAASGGAAGWLGENVFFSVTVSPEHISEAAEVLGATVGGATQAYILDALGLSEWWAKKAGLE